MTRTVLISKPQPRGNTNRMIRATVMHDNGDTLQVVVEGQNKTTTVKASEVREAPAMYGNRAASDRRVVVQKALPDSPGSLVRILEKRGF